MRAQVLQGCSVPAALIGNLTFTSSCDGLTHGQSCLSVCNPGRVRIPLMNCFEGYAGLPSQHLCSDGSLLGGVPNCVPEPCTFEGGVRPARCWRRQASH